MYGKGVGAVTTATGVAVLPETGNSSIVFVLAIGLLVSGTILLTTSVIAARKANKSN